MPRADGVSALTTLPSNDSVPEVMSSRPAIRRSKVDFPQPEGPTNTMNSPALISRSTPLMTSTGPKDLRTFCITMLVIAWPSTFDAAGREARDDLALENEHEDNQRQRDDHAGRHD